MKLSHLQRFLLGNLKQQSISNMLTEDFVCESYVSRVYGGAIDEYNLTECCIYKHANSYVSYHCL